MMRTITYPDTAEPLLNNQTDTAISHLLSAAVINQNFRETLLSDPDRALAEGFSGFEFNLDDKQRELILSIQARSLQDFAVQLVSV